MRQEGENEVKIQICPLHVAICRQASLDVTGLCEMISDAVRTPFWETVEWCCPLKRMRRRRRRRRRRGRLRRNPYEGLSSYGRGGAFEEDDYA